MEKQHLLNNQIKAEKVLLLGPDGEKLGDMSLREAIYRANEKELDLMQVGQKKDASDKKEIAICKLINYESWIYHENKKKEKQEFQNRSHDMKSMQFRPNIGDNDFNLKIKKISEFLDDNHKVKIVIKLKSREGAMRSINEAVVQKIIDALAEHGALDSKPNWGFKEINFIIKPEKKLVAKNKP